MIGHKPIPHLDFGGDGPPLHFAHANGYPPEAYKPLLNKLSANYRLMAMRMRPLWQNSDPASFQDWQPLSSDLLEFLGKEHIGTLFAAGHSMGATATIRLALSEPERFNALVLIDPVLFPPRIVLVWEIIYRLGLSYRLHPLAKTALRRKQRFQNKQAMFDNYRQKRVFRYLDDRALWAYVESMALTTPEGDIILTYPSKWEAQVYVTGLRSDRDIWNNISNLKPPLLVIRGSESDTYWESTSKLLMRKLPSAEIITIPFSTHLVPLERPDAVYNEMHRFLNRCGAITPSTKQLSILDST